ncbi:MAG: hypothetical protein HFG20_04300 [Anaerotruncus sp.]|jgi:hypothetical protein|nr:hypothetical protein [Anaerotruncus sp.]
MRKSTQVAMGGLAAALCLLLMFMTGLVPFSSYVFPCFAGIVLVAVAAEIGAKTAFLVYIGVSILSIFIVPDPEAKLLFIILLGYYPILKPVLERLPRLLAWVAKLLLVNGMLVAFYYICLYVLGLPDLLSEWGRFGDWAAYIMLGMANFTFFMYDYLLKQVLYLYQYWFRPKILRNITN